MGEQATAFVAGATGHTGRAVVRALVDRGARVVAHVRPDSSRLEHWREQWSSRGVEVDTTAWEPAAMEATLQRIAPTHVFGLLGTTRKRAAREGMDARAAYERIDYGMTAMLFAAAAACGSEPRLVYVSATGLSETTRNPYMQVRVRIERMLREGTLPYLIGRPSFIVGERDEHRAAEHWGARMADGVLSTLGALGAKTLAARYRSTTGEALGAALVALALDDATPRQHLAESEALRLD